VFFLFLLLVAGSVFLMRRGVAGPPPWLTRQHSPEHEAKRVLAERFARGDISSDDFLERASVLNWTPGSDTWQTTKKKRH
jgi:putative membrane protein